MKVIISTDFAVEFLEDYSRYRAEVFNVNYTFNVLSNDVSHFVVAYNLYMFKVCRHILISSIFSKKVIDTELKFST